MGTINQPMSQIRLTNVSLVRMRKGKKRFEIACYQNKVQDWRSKVEKDLDEVLQIPQVFTNVSKGQVANNDDLMASFGTTDQDQIIGEILSKGEIQLNEKERQANQQQKHNEFLTIILTKCINPKLKKRYPPSMINKALEHVQYHMNPQKPAKTQALEAIRILVEKQVFPIARAQMKVRIVLSKKAYDKIFEKELAPLISIDEESRDLAQRWLGLGVIDPINYRRIIDMLEGDQALITSNEGSIEVLEMAVLKEND